MSYKVRGNGSFQIQIYRGFLISHFSQMKNLWDKGYIAYLADVIVNPEYQGQGIGKKMVQECIKYIDNQLKEGWRIKIVIVASKGKEAFYEKLGFKARPNDNDGPGMDMWRE